MKYINALVSITLSIIMMVVLCFYPLFLVHASEGTFDNLEVGEEVGDEAGDEVDNDDEIEHQIVALDTIEVDTPIQVAIPTDLDFFIDPFNISGNGTLYSPEFSIANYSDVDLILHIKDIAYTFSGKGSFLSLTEAPELYEIREEKAVFMFLRHIIKPIFQLDDDHDHLDVEQLYAKQIDDYMITDRFEGDGLTILLKAANYDEEGNFISLNEDSIFHFTLMGGVTIPSRVFWETGDLTIRMSYSWEVIEEDEIAEDESDDVTVDDAVIDDDPSDDIDDSSDDIVDDDSDDAIDDVIDDTLDSEPTDSDS